MAARERLIQFIDFKKISKNKFYLNCGLPNGAFTTVKSIGSENLEKISSAFPELNMDWVITGRGEMQYQISNQKKKNMRLEFGKFLKNIMNHHSITKEQLLSEMGSYYTEDRLNNAFLFENEVDMVPILYIDKITGSKYSQMLGFEKTTCTEEKRVEIVNSINIIIENNGSIPVITADVESINNELLELLQKAASYSELTKKNDDVGNVWNTPKLT